MITALVVTYQRKDLLRQCLDALINQTYSVDKILVVDNASLDGTHEYFDGGGLFNLPDIEYLRLSENIGGAGGFHEGIKHIRQSSDSWIWMMDDDAIPEPGALGALIQVVNNADCIYGSTAIANQGNHLSLCWPVELSGTGSRVYTQNDLPDLCEVSLLPFLGFYFHSSLVDRIGLPVRDYFLSGDDTEYCLRASTHGIKLLLVGNSIIKHPKPDRIILTLGSRDISILRLPPWKRYYDVRNRILIARIYYPFRLWTQTLPGIVLRWIFILFKDDCRFKQSSAFARGLKDGFMGNKGTRWTPGT